MKHRRIVEIDLLNQVILESQARALSRKADREAQTKQQTDAFQPVRQTSKKSRNPALQMFNYPKSSQPKESSQKMNIQTQRGPSQAPPEQMKADGPSQSIPEQMEDDL